MHNYLSKEHVCLGTIMEDLGSCERNYDTEPLHFTTTALWKSFQVPDIGHVLLLAKGLPRELSNTIKSQDGFISKREEIDQ